ncbi:MAG: class I SAM-dependent methyltransferase [Methylocystis sp.]
MNSRPPRPPVVSDTGPGLAIPEIWPKRPLPERAVTPPGDDEAIKAAALRDFDEAAEHFSSGRWREGMTFVDRACKTSRLALPSSKWNAFAKQDCIAHPVREFLHLDPFTRRSFEKPRGHAGDAVLIDYMYGIAHPEHELARETPLGRWIHNYTTNTHAPRAVRRRMHVIAELIDRVCIERRHARVLSVASGHARELAFSHALRAGVLDEVVAFDQDARSLAEAESAMGSKALKTMHGSIVRLIAGRYDLSGFDLVYTAGLFDYVDGRAGKRLVKTMFDMLRPGGMLLVGNFLTDIEDIGYMESFMDWNLVFRGREEIVGLADGIEEGLGALRYFEESESNIGFLLATKAG